jgi:hypothetical protein
VRDIAKNRLQGNDCRVRNVKKDPITFISQLEDVGDISFKSNVRHRDQAFLFVRKARRTAVVLIDD